MQRWNNTHQHPPTYQTPSYSRKSYPYPHKPKSQPPIQKNYPKPYTNQNRNNTPQARHSISNHTPGYYPSKRPISFRQNEISNMRINNPNIQRSGNGYSNNVVARNIQNRPNHTLGSHNVYNNNNHSNRMQLQKNMGNLHRGNRHSLAGVQHVNASPRYAQQNNAIRNRPFKRPRKSHPIQNVFLNSQQSIQAPIRSLSHNTFNMGPGNVQSQIYEEKPRSMISRPGNLNRGPVRVNNIRQINDQNNLKKQIYVGNGQINRKNRQRVISQPNPQVVQHGIGFKPHINPVSRRSVDFAHHKVNPSHVKRELQMKTNIPPRRSTQSRSPTDPQAKMIQAMRQSLELNPSIIISTSKIQKNGIASKKPIIEIHNNSIKRRSVDAQQTPKFGSKTNLKPSQNNPIYNQNNFKSKQNALGDFMKESIYSKSLQNNVHNTYANAKFLNQPRQIQTTRTVINSSNQARAKDVLSSQYRSSLERNNIPQNSNTLVLTDSGGFSEFTVSNKQSSLQNQMPNLKMFVSEKGPHRRMSDFPVHQSHHFSKNGNHTMNFKKSNNVGGLMTQKRPRMSLNPKIQTHAKQSIQPLELSSLDRFSKNSRHTPSSMKYPTQRSQEEKSSLDKKHPLSSNFNMRGSIEPKKESELLASSELPGSNPNVVLNDPETANRTSLDKSVRSRISHAKSIKSFLDEKYKSNSLIVNYNTSKNRKSRLYDKSDRTWLESSALRKAVDGKLYGRSANLIDLKKKEDLKLSHDPKESNKINQRYNEKSERYEKQKDYDRRKESETIFENEHLKSNLDRDVNKKRKNSNQNKINKKSLDKRRSSKKNQKPQTSSRETQRYKKGQKNSKQRISQNSHRIANPNLQLKIPTTRENHPKTDQNDPATLRKFPDSYKDSPKHPNESQNKAKIFDVSEREDDNLSPTHRESLFQPDISNIQGNRNLRTSLFAISNNLSTIISKMNEKRRKGTESQSESHFAESIKDSHHLLRMQTLGNDIRDLESRRSEMERALESQKWNRDNGVDSLRSQREQAEINMVVAGLKESGVFDLPEVKEMFKKHQQEQHYVAGQRAIEIGKKMENMVKKTGSERFSNTDQRLAVKGYESNFAKKPKSKFGRLNQSNKESESKDKNYENLKNPKEDKESQYLLKPKREDQSQEMSNLIYSQDDSSYAPKPPSYQEEQHYKLNPNSKPLIQRMKINPFKQPKTNQDRHRQPNAPANSPAPTPTRLMHTQELQAKGFKPVTSPTMRSQNSTHLHKTENVKGENLIRRLSRNFDGQRHSNAVSWAQLNQQRHFKTMPAEKSFSQRKGLGEELKGKDNENMSQIEFMMWDNGRSNSQIWHKKREYTYEFNDLTYGAKPVTPKPKLKSHFGEIETKPKPKVKKKKLKLKKKAPKKRKKSKTPKKKPKKKKKKSKTPVKNSKKPKKKRTIIRRKKTVTRYVKGKGGKRERKSVVTTTIEKVPKKKTVKGKTTVGNEYITTVQKSVVVGGSIRNSVIQTSSTHDPGNSVHESLATDGANWPKLKNKMKAVRSIRGIRGGSIDAGLTRSSIQFKTADANTGKYINFWGSLFFILSE